MKISKHRRQVHTLSLLTAALGKTRGFQQNSKSLLCFCEVEHAPRLCTRRWEIMQLNQLIFQTRKLRVGNLFPGCPTDSAMAEQCRVRPSTVPSAGAPQMQVLGCAVRSGELSLRCYVPVG